MTQPPHQIPTERPAKKSRWRRLVKWSLRTLIVLIVLGIALYATASYWTARTIRNEIARIRAAGEPVTFADLNAMTPQADRAQDAGPLYQAAAILAAALPGLPDVDSYLAIFQPEGMPSPKVLADAQHLVDQGRTALDLLDRAAALPECSATIDIESGMSVALRNLGRYNGGLQNAASLRTRVLAFQHDGDRAVQSLAAQLPLTRVFDRQPVLIAFLTQEALVARSARDAALILEYGRPTDAGLASLADAMATVHPVDRRRVLLAERVYFIEASRSIMLPHYQPDPSAPDALPVPESWSRQSGGLTARMLATDNLLLESRLIAAASGDWPHTLDALNEIADHPGSAWTLSGVTNRILAPSVARAELVNVQILSVWQSTRTAVDLERYRLAHAGALPDSLGNLPDAAALPADPLTNKPLLYTKTPDGYCIYSAGYHPPADRDKNPIDWSKKWGIHIRTTPPQ